MLAMATTDEKLEDLFARVRALPKARRQAAVDALAEIAEGFYQLSDEETAVLRPALEDAHLGNNLEEADEADVLHKPWG
jgi:hypothetical protein